MSDTTTTSSEAPPAVWANRITRYDPEVDPATLNPHNRNPREHPEYQRSTMRGALESVGWVGPVIVNERTGNMIDGHMRTEEAEQHGNTVPVIYVDLDEETERLALATYDPITSLASYNSMIATGLLDQIVTRPAALMGLLDDMAAVHTPMAAPPLGIDGVIGEEGKHTEDQDSVFWPVISVTLHPDTKARWDLALADTGHDPANLITQMLTAGGW